MINLNKHQSVRWAMIGVFHVTWIFYGSWVSAQTANLNGVQVPGVVLNHSPTSSGVYLTSPTLAILPNGDYVAAHSVNSSSGVTQLYRSTDQGQTWAPLSGLTGQFWSNLFVHNDDLYIMGTNGFSLVDVVIRRSTDSGATWITPSNSTNGLFLQNTSSYGYHVANVLRVDVDRGRPEKAAIARIQDNSTLTFDPDNDIVDMPCAAKKFTIRYHTGTDRYWTLVQIVTDANQNTSVTPSSIRNIVAALSSDDLRSWEIERIVLEDLSDPSNIGFAYLDWQFDSSDIVAVSRTAFPDSPGGASRAHNANFLTFHRVAGIVPEPMSQGTLLGDANNDGQVTGADLIPVQRNYGNVEAGSPSEGLMGDANDGGQVTGAELISVQQNFGNVVALASVPVFATSSVALLSVMVTLVTGRN